MNFVWKKKFYHNQLNKMFFVFSSVLRFVGPTDNIYSCSFVQMLEQRLENAFEEAQDKVLETYNRLTVEVLQAIFSANRANVKNNAQSDVLDTYNHTLFPRLLRNAHTAPLCKCFTAN